MKISHLTEEIAADLTGGAYGGPGTPFPTARTLVGTFGVSFDSASGILAALKERRLIRLGGNRYYVTTGYVPPQTPYGERLSRTRRGFLGLIVNSVGSPFFSSLAKELSDVSARAGYPLLIADTGNQPDRDPELIDRFVEDGAAGIFTAPSIAAAPEYYARCPLPLVSLGRDLGIPNCDAVTADNRAAGRQVAEHLWSIGCTRFAYVGIRRYLREDPRLSGFAAQLRAYGTELAGDTVLAADHLADGGLDYGGLSGILGSLLYRMAKGEKLGIFCYHDLLASYILQRVKHYSHLSPGRYRIPEDIAIVGFDDLPIASAIVPPLTTVQYPYASIAEAALSRMLDYMKNPAHLPEKRVIPSSLCTRGSSVRAEADTPEPQL